MWWPDVRNYIKCYFKLKKEKKNIMIYKKESELNFTNSTIIQRTLASFKLYLLNRHLSYIYTYMLSVYIENYDTDSKKKLFEK